MVKVCYLYDSKKYWAYNKKKYLDIHERKTLKYFNGFTNFQTRQFFVAFFFYFFCCTEK